MVTKELLEGVRKLEEAGAGPADIRSILESRGWNGADIEEVFSRAIFGRDTRGSTPSKSGGLALGAETPVAEERQQEAPPLAPETRAPAPVEKQPEEVPQAARVNSAPPPAPSMPAAVPSTASVPVGASLAGPDTLAREALSLVRERFWALVGVTIVATIFVAAAIYLLHSGLSSLSLNFFKIPFAEFLRGGAAGFDGMSLFMGWLPMFVLILAMASLITWIPASQIAALGSGEAKLGGALKLGFARQTALFSTLLLFVFFASLGMLAIVPGIIFILWFGLAPFVSMYEKEAGLSALVKSREYMRGRFSEVVGRQVFLLVPVLILLFFFLLVAFPLLYFGDTSSLSMSEAAYLMFALVALVTAFIFFHFFVLGYQAALYRNLKSLASKSPSRDKLGTLLAALALIAVLGGVLVLAVFPEAADRAFDLVADFAGGAERSLMETSNAF